MNTTQTDRSELLKLIAATKQAIKTLDTALYIAHDNRDGDAISALYNLRSKLMTELFDLQTKAL